MAPAQPHLQPHNPSYFEDRSSSGTSDDATDPGGWPGATHHVVTGTEGVQFLFRLQHDKMNRVKEVLRPYLLVLYQVWHMHTKCRVTQSIFDRSRQ